MLNFMTLPPANDMAAQMIKRRLEEYFKDIDGLAYYRHSIARTNNNVFPDFTVFTRVNQPLIIKIVCHELQEISLADSEELWIVNDNQIEPPPLELEDLKIKVDNQFRQERKLRNILKPQAILAFPFIIQKDFEKKLGTIQADIRTLWAGNNSETFHCPLDHPLSDEEWIQTRAVIQGVTNLHRPSKQAHSIVSTLGDAIRELDKDIAALDDDQEAAVVKIAPGPQRIRGLAGTGKTVLLAMKAAEIHHQYPDSKILFTFNTHSLYNQAKDLISRAYRSRAGEDPDWDFLHVRHAWGGKSKPGVYSDTCAQQGRMPLNFEAVRRFPDPFQQCCRHALEKQIFPQYDFILADEAQDFPREFFRILYKLSSAEHRIYWAYDELQSLSSLEIPKPEDLFGTDRDGKPLVSLDGEYPEGIEKDIVLLKSYRCPLPVLMLAHAIGLGIKSQQGCVQMLENRGDWEAVGYQIESGNLQKDENVVIFRPANNSPNRIYDIYNKQELIITNVFSRREDELSWVANAIRKDIKEEKVVPHKIVVISLASKVGDHFAYLREQLAVYGIASVAPGVFKGDPPDAFAINDKVTLATVYKAKGNETYIVYIIGFDALYDYIEGIGNRNKAFASITRSKAWVRITGIGKKMEIASEEITSILADIPKFKFTFPDTKKIRRLGAESSKRKTVLNRAEKSANTLIGTEKEALEALDVEKLKKLQNLLNEVINEQS